MHDRDHFVDRLLDASLASYGNHQPPLGLEQRVLARLAGEPQPAAGWRWLPLGALAAAALLAVVFLFPHRETTPAPSTIGSQPLPVTSTAAPVAPPSPPLTAALRPAQPRPGATQVTNTLVRAQQFPRPGALTDQERHLMSYLNSTPREVLVAAVRSDAGSNRPIRDLLLRDVEVPRLELNPLPEQSGESMEN